MILLNNFLIIITKMRGSEFEFDGINFIYYHFNKTSINRGGSYIDSPKWFKDKN